MSVRSLLIVRLSALGDVIHVLPALAALRAAYPRAKLGWVVEDRAASLLQGHPQLDRLHVVPRKALTAGIKRGDLLGVAGGLRRSITELRRERYEVALDFQSNFRSSALTFLSKAPRRIGQPKPFSKEGSPLFYTDVPRPVAADVMKIERNLELLRPLGVHPGRAPRPSFATDSWAAFEATLPAKQDAQRWVVIHAGVSAFGALKAWREVRFAELGERLGADGHRVFFAWGGAKEEAQAKRLAAAAPGTQIAPPTEDLHQLSAFLRQADLFVGVDSGPLHLAAALGTAALGVYGPKHPGTYGPFWPGTRVVRADEHCSPCKHRKCPREDAAIQADLPGGPPLKISPCMDAVSVDAALAAARELLAQVR